MIKKQLFAIFGDLQKVLSDLEECPQDIKKTNAKDIDRSLDVLRNMIDRIGDRVRKFSGRSKTKS